MFSALFSRRGVTVRSGIDVPGGHIHHPSSQSVSARGKNIRLSNSLFALLALGACTALAGCGGLTVSGKTASAALSDFSCTATNVNSATTDSCTVTLTTAAPVGGAEVALTSSSSSVAVPTMITVPINATSANFTATISAVQSSQTVILSSASNGTNKSVTLQLNPAGSNNPGNPAPTTKGAALTVNASSVPFGNVGLGIPSTQSLTLHSTGSESVSVTGIRLTGTGFSDSGINLPLTLKSGQSATLNLQFTPTATGSQSGNLTITSNSTTGTSLVIPVSGTGIPLQIALNWDAPSGTAVSGYNIYRATGTGSTFQKLNSSLHAPDSYTDSSIKTNTTYQYYVTSIDTAGAESTPSNTATVVVP